MQTAPIWALWVPAVVAALVALMLGIPTLVLARRQKVIAEEAKQIAAQNKEVAQAKLKLDLFERRMVIFNAVSSVLWSATLDKTLNDEKIYVHFPAALFLFGPEIEKYLRLVNEKRNALWQLQNLQGQGPTPQEASETVKLQRWFMEEATMNVRHTFAPYLDFSKWK